MSCVKTKNKKKIADAVVKRSGRARSSILWAIQLVSLFFIDDYNSATGLGLPRVGGLFGMVDTCSGRGTR